MKDEALTTPPESSAAEAAVLYLLKRIRIDADLRWHLVGTEAFARLVRAEAARSGQELHEVYDHYSRPAPDDDGPPAQLPAALRRLADIAELVADLRQCLPSPLSPFAAEVLTKIHRTAEEM